jgi:hypothetical protein
LAATRRPNETPIERANCFETRDLFQPRESGYRQQDDLLVVGPVRLRTCFTTRTAIHAAPAEVEIDGTRI